MSSGNTVVLILINQATLNEWPYPNIKSYVFTHQAMKNNENAELISNYISLQ
ncbi:hypothetical protein [Clostridium botulinum]|uniref:Uncharacterized protein n=3 Tax=Clostridium botulinum TaxID=1491 RepID=A5I049_CLOBH|nr:hypothetical protein [Clostridium botulinum]EKN42207.1 hypothetical protein CFSAN001627_08287 [Clostridium botulinum CFSAN001627]EKX81136.1 hypothetical protein CFSAN001628_002047 [Clostridium botulinum CFSAN001628]EPS51881.1 hypothetical protein CFSAN002367_02966 [Clostridium botulinum CFSAN002367]ACA46492.1 conserved hypothetical protein [Clostridium botulinum B1 str. Okra]APQ97248.1 hypothetical protein RSJ3_3013 [Clostridium botulinum]